MSSQDFIWLLGQENWRMKEYSLEKLEKSSVYFEYFHKSRTFCIKTIWGLLTVKSLSTSTYLRIKCWLKYQPVKSWFLISSQWDFFQRIRSRFQTYISMKFSRQIFIKKQSKFCKLLVHKLQKRDFIGLVHSSPLLPSGTRRLFSFWGFFVNLQLKYKLQHSRGSDKLWNIWVNCSVKEILFIKWNYIIVKTIRFNSHKALIVQY